MRIWHHKLIPYLPTDQLKAMRYELGDMIQQYPNTKNRLVSYANGYSIIFLGTYFGKVCVECEKRGIKCSSSYNNKIYGLVFEKGNNLFANYRFNEDTDEYLRICLMNLYEKHIRGIIPDEEWKIIEERFGDVLKCVH